MTTRITSVPQPSSDLTRTVYIDDLAIGNLIVKLDTIESIGAPHRFLIGDHGLVDAKLLREFADHLEQLDKEG